MYIEKMAKSNKIREGTNDEEEETTMTTLVGSVGSSEGPGPTMAGTGGLTGYPTRAVVLWNKVRSEMLLMLYSTPM